MILSTAQAAKRLGVTPHDVAYLCRTGRLRATRWPPEPPGAAQWHISEQDLEKYIASERAAAGRKRRGRPTRVSQAG